MVQSCAPKVTAALLLGSCAVMHTVVDFIKMNLKLPLKGAF